MCQSFVGQPLGGGGYSYVYKYVFESIVMYLATPPEQ